MGHCSLCSKYLVHTCSESDVVLQSTIWRWRWHVFADWNTLYKHASSYIISSCRPVLYDLYSTVILTLLRIFESGLQCFDTVDWWQEGHLACINLGIGLLVVTVWLELRTSCAPVVTTTSIVLSSNKTGKPRFTWKMAVKTERERERERERDAVK